MNLPSKPIVAGSILDCSIWQLKTKIKSAVKGGMQWLHYDVIDGHYVSKITFGDRVLANLKQQFPTLCFDCHFMVKLNPDLNLLKYFEPFITAGADLLTVQLDSFACDQQIYNFLTLKKTKSIKLGIAINFDHSWTEYHPWIKYFDSITVMGVVPGAGGQPFCVAALDQIMRIKRLIKTYHWSKIIQIDGGVKTKEAIACYQAGAQIIVMGSFLFNNQIKPANVIKMIEQKLVDVKNNF